MSQLQDQHFSFGYQGFDGEEKVFAPLFKSEQYTWGKEVTRALSGEIQWRHDVFGAQSLHRHTERCPWVAIEVVDSHFPDEQAMEAWLELSSRLPYFVLFDFVKRKNYFLKVDESSRRVRIIYFIYDGSVWKSGKRWDRCTAAFFKEKVSEEISRV